MIFSLKNKVVPLFTPFVQQGLSPVLIRGLSLFEKQGLSPIKLMGRKTKVVPHFSNHKIMLL